MTARINLNRPDTRPKERKPDRWIRDDWRVVPGYPGYEVNPFGDIRRAIGGSNSKAGKRIKTRYGTNGYPRVTLHRDCKKWDTHVHRVVALTFLGPPPSPDAQVAHNDGSRDNNFVGNLRWTDAKGNAADRIQHGTTVEGAGHPRSKLTAAAVRDIRRSKKHQRVLARKYGVSQAAIWAARNRQSWKSVEC